MQNTPSSLVVFPFGKRTTPNNYPIRKSFRKKNSLQCGNFSQLSTQLSRTVRGPYGPPPGTWINISVTEKCVNCFTTVADRLFREEDIQEWVISVLSLGMIWRVFSARTTRPTTTGLLPEFVKERLRPCWTLADCAAPQQAPLAGVDSSYPHKLLTIIHEIDNTMPKITIYRHRVILCHLRLLLQIISPWGALWVPTNLALSDDFRLLFEQYHRIIMLL